MQTNAGFRKLLYVSLISGAGSALVPIAFAIETIRIEPRGWGMASVLIALWIGRFWGMTIYKKRGYKYTSVSTMICAVGVMGLAQLGLLVTFLALSESLAAMLASSFIYGLASAFFGPSLFVTIPLVTSEDSRMHANSLLSMIGDVYGIVGPMVGATLVILLGFKYVLAIDALTFFITILILMSLRTVLQDLTNDERAETFENPKISTGSIFEFPVWVRFGFLSWFFISVAIGFMGAAGPTLIIARYSEVDWAFVATTMALGSLLGSAMSLAGFGRNIEWSKIHLICGFALGIQLTALGLANEIWLLCIAAFFGSASVTASGIRWDTFGQSQFSGRQIHAFASLDQFTGTLGIPTGMLLFGLVGLAGFSVEMTVFAGCMAFAFTIPVAVIVKRRVAT